MRAVPNCLRLRATILSEIIVLLISVGELTETLIGLKLDPL
jgi:hypothetical protein